MTKCISTNRGRMQSTSSKVCSTRCMKGLSVRSCQAGVDMTISDLPPFLAISSAMSFPIRSIFLLINERVWVVTWKWSSFVRITPMLLEVSTVPSSLSLILMTPYGILAMARIRETTDLRSMKVSGCAHSCTPSVGSPSFETLPMMTDALAGMEALASPAVISATTMVGSSSSILSSNAQISFTALFLPLLMSTPECPPVLL